MKDTKSHSVMECYKADARIAELEAENAKLRDALELYPEWMVDDDEWSATSQYVTCLICGGGGRFNWDGKPSKRLPPTHKPDCARQSALRQSEGGGE